MVLWGKSLQSQRPCCFPKSLLNLGNPILYSSYLPIKFRGPMSFLFLSIHNFFLLVRNSEFCFIYRTCSGRRNYLKKRKKKHGLKNWILHKDHFKTHLFFFNFRVGGPFSAWIRVWRGCLSFKLSREAIWQVSEDPYHTEFVSWRVDLFLFFIFFPRRGGGHTLSGKFHYFF